MTEAARHDPFKRVHLELMAVVVGFLWTDIRSDDIETRDELCVFNISFRNQPENTTRL